MRIVTFVAVVLIAVKSYFFNTDVSKNVAVLKSGIADTVATQAFFIIIFILFYFIFLLFM